MDDSKVIHEDLQYVRHAVERNQHAVLPLSIALFWGPVMLIGFSLIDLHPAWVGWFWLIAGPVGFIVSSTLGMLHNRRSGNLDRVGGKRVMWHFLGLMGAIALSALLVQSGELTSTGLGRQTLLLLAFAYFTAGLQYSRALLWISLLLAAGFIALGSFHNHVWTGLGVLSCIALLAAGLAERSHE